MLLFTALKQGVMILVLSWYGSGGRRGGLVNRFLSLFLLIFATTGCEAFEVASGSQGAGEAVRRTEAELWKRREPKLTRDNYATL